MSKIKTNFNNSDFKTKIPNALPDISKVYEKIFQSIKNPLLTQKHAFSKIMKQVSNSAISRTLKLDNITSYQEFIKKIPINEYEFFEPFIKKTAEGEDGQLFKERPEYFLTSSGTTAVNKILPCSKEMAEIFRDFQLQTMSIMSSISPNICFDSPTISLGSKSFIASIQDIPQGYLSGLIATDPHNSLKKNRYPSKQTLQIDDYFERTTKIFEETKNADIQILWGLPTQILNLINEVLKLTGKQTLTEVWPNISAIGYGGTPIENYVHPLYKAIGKNIPCIGIYMATESPMGIEIPEISKGNHTFVPMCEHSVFSFSDTDHPNALPLCIDELKEGGEYYVNISNMSGLIQYPMKDCIRITSVSPYLTFQVLGRQGADLNVSSERISQNTILEVIADLQKQLNCSIDHFFIYPIIDNEKPYYEWVLSSDNLQSISLNNLQKILDETLMEKSINYKLFRKEFQTLLSPTVKIIPQYLTQNYHERENGRGQFKMKTIFQSQKDFEIFWQKSIPGIGNYLKNIYSH